MRLKDDVSMRKSSEKRQETVQKHERKPAHNTLLSLSNLASQTLDGGTGPFLYFSFSETLSLHLRFEFMSALIGSVV